MYAESDLLTMMKSARRYFIPIKKFIAFQLRYDRVFYKHPEKYV